MGNSSSSHQKDNLLSSKETDKNLEKFLRPEVKISDIRNISKAFKLLDKNNEGYIFYDVAKFTESKY